MEKYILFYSDPGYSDNALYLYKYIQKHNIHNFKFIWLVKHKNSSFINTKDTIFLTPRELLADISLHDQIILSLISHTSTPQSYKKYNDKQIIINLSHGQGAKGQKKNEIKTLNGEPFPGCLFDYIITTGGCLINNATKKFNNVNDGKILPFGYPRNDILFNNKNKSKVNDKNVFNILWMPTFRQRLAKKLSENYFTNETQIQLFNKFEDIKKFSLWLEENKLILTIKTHRLQKHLNVYDFIKTNCSNSIKIFEDKDIKNLYDHIHIYDALLTDYSSIYVDYLFLNKPMGFIFDDIEEYKFSRGDYNYDPIEHSPGYHIYKIEDLKNFCLDIKNNRDDYSQARYDSFFNFHKYNDGNASERIYNFILEILSEKCLIKKET